MRVRAINLYLNSKRLQRHFWFILQLALKFHPDKNPDNPDATEKVRQADSLLNCFFFTAGTNSKMPEIMSFITVER